jgi:hypothetical protein
VHQVAVASVSKSNGLAISSMVLGIGSAFVALLPVVGLLSVPFAVVGLVLGIAGASRAAKGYEGSGLAVAGIVTSVVALAISALYVFAFGALADDVDPPSRRSNTEVDPATGRPENGSREQPLPAGQAHDIGDGWTVRVAAFNPDGNQAVADANMFNEPPAAGRRYVIVTPEATYTGDAETANAYDITFRLVGASGVTIDEEFMCVAPEPNWTDLTEVFPGGTLTGNLCFSVPETDVDSLVLIAEPTMAFSGNRAFLALR